MQTSKAQLSCLILGILSVLSFQNCKTNETTFKALNQDLAASQLTPNVSIGATTVTSDIIKTQLSGTWQEPCISTDSVQSSQQSDTFDTTGQLTVSISYFNSNSSCTGVADMVKSFSGTYLASVSKKESDSAANLASAAASSGAADPSVQAAAQSFQGVFEISIQINPSVSMIVNNDFTASQLSQSSYCGVLWQAGLTQTIPSSNSCTDFGSTTNFNIGAEIHGQGLTFGSSETDAWLLQTAETLSLVETSTLPTMSASN
jgi:hypothetical protein